MKSWNSKHLTLGPGEKTRNLKLDVTPGKLQTGLGHLSVINFSLWSFMEEQTWPESLRQDIGKKFTLSFQEQMQHDEWYTEGQQYRRTKVIQNLTLPCALEQTGQGYQNGFWKKGYSNIKALAGDEGNYK